MKLWLVTFEMDLTQFVMEAETEDEAIRKANFANKKIGGIEESEEDDFIYSAEKLDWELLAGLLKRTDYVGEYAYTIVFNN